MLFASINVYGINDNVSKGTISGFVKDAKSDKGIEYANIVVYSLPDSTMITGTVSAADGSFIIKKLPYGNYYLETNFIGYMKKTISELNVRRKKTVLETIYLKPSIQKIENVEVVGEKALVEYKIDKKVINVSQHINADGGTAVDVLQNIPSVQTDASGNVTLRGSSSFTVLIDGRPTVMTGSEALQNIPASTINTIEIITNPSAKHDPDGVSGIINLIMKKQKFAGFNGIVNTGLMTGDKYWGSTNFNYRTGKLNFFVGADYSHKRQITESGTDRELYSANTLYTTIRTDRTTYRDKHGVKGGIDYYINDKNTLSVSGEYGFWGFERQLENKYHDYTSDYSTNNYKIGEDIFNINNDYVTANTNYSHIFNNKEHEISFELFYSNTDNEIPYFLSEYDTDENYYKIDGTQYRMRTNNLSNRDFLRFKTDYVLPVNDKIKIETGYQSDFKILESSYLYEYINDNEWTVDNDLSNNLDFSRYIHSAYGIFSSELFGFQYQLGLRAEYSQRSLKQNKSENTYDYDKLNFFPSVHLSKKLPKEQQIQLSYSRRITRPTEWNLNPNPKSTDSYYIEVGNPDLEPDYTDAYELNYQKRFKKLFFSTEMYYRQTKNPIYRTLTTMDDIMVMTYNNLDYMYSAGFEIMSYFTLKKWWKINVNANIYYTALEGNIENTYDVSQSTTTGNGRFTNTFSFKTKTQFQFMAVYYAPGVSPQGESEHFYYFDFILKQFFLKRKLAITLRTHNTFDTGKYIYTTSGNDYSANSFYIYEGPVFIFSLSYKINNYKRKKRSTIEQDFDSGLD